MTQEKATLNLSRPQQGPFTLAVYRTVIEKVIEGSVFTLTVSTGDEERIFFFTRGAILFLAVGTSGGEVLARKLVHAGLLAPAQADALTKRANADTPLLQDLVREEDLVDPKALARTIEATIEDHLLEVMLWEGGLALYDLVPGNPPPRLYDPDVPAVRLSVGAKPLLERILARREEAARHLGTFGALRNRVRVEAGAALEGRLAEHVSATPRPIADVLVAAQRAGEPPFQAAGALAALVQAKKVHLERVPERSRQEEVAQALRIEDAFEHFLNGLLARTHLAAIYERVADKEKAAEQYRGIADEHLKRDAIDAGVQALRSALRLVPQDVSARELIVKVLRGANRLEEAGREAVELARVFLDQNFPGRARQAYELALKLVPKNLPVLWMLAGLLALLGEKNAAAARYEEIAQLAREKGDPSAEFAAYQQVLDLDPYHAKALEVVRRLSGYRDAMRRQVAAVSLSFVLFLLVLAYGAYELAALSAYEKARDKARVALEEASFDVARSSVEEFRRGWTLTRLRSSAEGLLASIGEEEKLWRAQRSLEEERVAKALEAKDQLPRARDAWRAAGEDASDPDRKQALQGALAACEAKIKRVKEDMERARDLERQSLQRPAHDLIESDLAHAPWLAEDKDFREPLLVDSIPKEARITIEGEPQAKPTPFLLRRPLTPVHVRLDGRNREPLEWEIQGPQPWPLVLVLPKKALWRTADVVAATPPLLHQDLAIVGGTDRTVTAVARDTGAIRWRAALGVFGECDASLVALRSGLILARARAGSVVGLSSQGTVRFTRELEPPPFDPLEPHPERLAALDAGAVGRAGARGLALVSADGAVVWRKSANGDLVGAPCAANDLVLASAERRLLAFKAASGELAWSVDLPQSPVLGPALGPRGTIFVPLEQGAIAIVERGSAHRVSVVRDLFDGGVATIEGDERFALVGSQQGDLVGLDVTGKVVLRAFTDQQRPVTWVRASTYSVLMGDAAMLYVLDAHEGKELWRHPVREGAPAAADDRQVFQGARDGFSSYDR